MDGEMGLTPEELAELRQVYSEGHAAGYAESYVKGVQDAHGDSPCAHARDCRMGTRSSRRRITLVQKRSASPLWFITSLAYLSVTTTSQ